MNPTRLTVWVDGWQMQCCGECRVGAGPATIGRTYPRAVNPTRRTVWVDGWQMQCCGEPMSVGSHVTWTLRQSSDPEFATAVLGEELATSLTHDEEHHGGLPDDAPVTTGTVRSIRAASCRYGPTGDDPQALYPLPGSLQLTEKVTADGWEPETDDMSFVAYIVELDVTEADRG